jgi:hypothetical protein
VAAAARTLTILVTTYIVTNALESVVLVWELIDAASLSNEHGEFYDWATKIINVSVLFG